jgi:uncharacterized protein
MKRKPESATKPTAKPAAKAKPTASAPPRPAGRIEKSRGSSGKSPGKPAKPPSPPAKAKGSAESRPTSPTAPAGRGTTGKLPPSDKASAVTARSSRKPGEKPKRPPASRQAPTVPPKEPWRAGRRTETSIEAEGRRYALGPTPVAVQPELLGELGELPDAYGSRRLFLAARDPHWLYAHWDFTAEQLREVNALSADRRPVLRVHLGSFAGPPCCEVQVHPGSRNWFVHVGQGGTKYVAELGYYREGDRVWTSLSRSEATLTPPDIAAADAEAEFATIPIDVPFETLSALIQAVAKQNVPLAEAILQLRAAGYQELPEVQDWPRMDWTPERESALAEAVSESLTLDGVRRAWVGSLEITELLRRGLLRQRGSVEVISSAGVGAIGRQVPPAPGSVSSPYGVPPSPKGFWFNVNAELILYGATEPDATVTLGGRVIRLRPDGTFSFRFALPDGDYELPAVAVSADGTDRRQAALEFSRSTVYEGDVGVHPQDPGLKKPEAAAVS